MENVVNYCLNKLRAGLDKNSLSECLELLENECDSNSARFLQAYLLESLNPRRAYEMYLDLRALQYWPASLRISVAIDDDKMLADLQMSSTTIKSQDEFDVILDQLLLELLETTTGLKRGLGDYCLGLACFLGNGFPENKKYGLELLVNSAQNGCKGAQRTVFEIYDTDESYQDKEAALYWFEKIFEYDSSVGVKLADRYLDGIGCKSSYENDKRAYGVLASLERSNNRAAINNLGWLYKNGRGCTQDYVMAKLLFERAAQMGSSASFFHLGELYEKGLGVKQDLEYAKGMYIESADRGNDRAKNRLKNWDTKL